MSWLKGHTIVEGKFRHGLPIWFSNIIEKHQLKRVSIYKITAGMNVWQIAPVIYEQGE